MLRQLYVADSNGKPSITVTILFYVMTLLAVVTYIESINALKTIEVTTGETVTVAPKGFSDAFMMMIIGLSIVVTTYYRQRQNKSGADAPAAEDASTGNGVIDVAKNYVSKIAGKFVK
jgi:hypothetical protein